LTACSFPGAVLRVPDSSWKRSISRSRICNGFYSDIKRTDRTVWLSGKAVDVFGRRPVRISLGTPVLTGCSCFSSRQMPEWYVDSARTASFQILSNSPIIGRYIVLKLTES
jgi:hypothetical protein